MDFKTKKMIRNVMHKNVTLKKFYARVSKSRTYLNKNMSDEEFAKKKYLENTGKQLNLKKPRTFNEKLWWLKLNNRDPLMTKVSDKYKVRDYVRETISMDILNPLLGVYDNIHDVPFDEIEEKVFIKTNKGSGENRIWDPTKPETKSEIIKYFDSVLENNYYFVSREWNYKNIEPKILVEKFMETDSVLGLVDYRFFCFDGKVEFVAVDIETTATDGSHHYDAKRNLYSPGFQYLKNKKIKREPFPNNLIEKPKSFSKMIDIAEKLSAPFVFCRVDLYYNDNSIIFGEITFYPGGGTQLLEPEEWEFEIGNLIDLKNKKIFKP